MPDVAPLLPADPAQVAGYRLTGRLGAGGQGVVYLGVAPGGGLVAVKLLRVEDERSRRQFAKEVAAAGRVAPFCTAQILDHDVEAASPYVVSEFIDGLSLQQYVAQHGPLSGTRLQRLAIGTVTALAAIHQVGVVHRDFKPANVMMSPDGPRVIDFGIARDLSNDTTKISKVFGTPAYMAPEQLRGERVGPQTDMFAWGSVMVFAATGRAPFEAPHMMAAIAKIANEEPDLSGLPPELLAVVRRSFSKDAAQRPSAQRTLSLLLGRPDATLDTADATMVLAEATQLVEASTTGPTAAYGDARAERSTALHEPPPLSRTRVAGRPGPTQAEGRSGPNSPIRPTAAQGQGSDSDGAPRPPAPTGSAPTGPATPATSAPAAFGPAAFGPAGSGPPGAALPGNTAADADPGTLDRSRSATGQSIVGPTDPTGRSSSGWTPAGWGTSGTGPSGPHPSGSNQMGSNRMGSAPSGTPTPGSAPSGWTPAGWGGSDQRASGQAAPGWNPPGETPPGRGPSGPTSSGPTSSGRPGSGWSPSGWNQPAGQPWAGGTDSVIEQGHRRSGSVSSRVALAGALAVLLIVVASVVLWNHMRNDNQQSGTTAAQTGAADNCGDRINVGADQAGGSDCGTDDDSAAVADTSDSSGSGSDSSGSGSDSSGSDSSGSTDEDDSDQVAATGTLPYAFEGVWEGEVSQPNGVRQSWNVRLELEGGQRRPGTMTSSDLGCSAQLKVVSSGYTTAKLRAPVPDRSDPNGVCARVGEITLLSTTADADQLSFAWQDTDNLANIGYAVLYRAED